MSQLSDRSGRLEATTAPKVGCRGVALAMGLALLLPFFVDHCPRRSGRPDGRLMNAAVLRAPRASACLEAWVLLRGYGGCPVLAEAGGYRLGLFCGATSVGGRGLLAFAGPFPGRAYLSQAPVPLGRWVHLAGLAPGDPSPGDPLPANPSPSAAARSDVSSPSPPSLPSPPLSQSSPLIAMDGADVTAGRPLAGAGAFPLGRDPWSERGAGGVGGAGDSPRGLDGWVGAWRLSRRWRSLAEVAAARGTPWRLGALAPLAPQGAVREERPPGPEEGAVGEGSAPWPVGGAVREESAPGPEGGNGALGGESAPGPAGGAVRGESAPGPEGGNGALGGESAPRPGGGQLGGLTPRGWFIVCLCLLLAAGMVAVGLALRVPRSGAPAWVRSPRALAVGGTSAQPPAERGR